MTLNLNDALGFSPFSPAFFGLLLPLQGRKSGPTLKDSRGRGFPGCESLQFGKKRERKEEGEELCFLLSPCGGPSRVVCVRDSRCVSGRFAADSELNLRIIRWLLSRW